MDILNFRGLITPLILFDQGDFIYFLAKVDDVIGYLAFFGDEKIFTKPTLQEEDITWLRMCVGKEGDIKERKYRRFVFSDKNEIWIDTHHERVVMRPPDDKRPSTYEGLIMEEVFRNELCLKNSS